MYVKCDESYVNSVLVTWDTPYDYCPRLTLQGCSSFSHDSDLFALKWPGLLSDINKMTYSHAKKVTTKPGSHILSLSREL